jgi:uncharacterized protein YodC (DUF2158 family)
VIYSIFKARKGESPGRGKVKERVMPQFNSGDVVRLMSGGPRMTVVNYGLYGMGATKESYLCKWFDDKNKVVENTFLEAELELVPAETDRTGGVTQSRRGEHGWMAN